MRHARLAAALVLQGFVAAAAAAPLEVVSATPTGVLEGDEQKRVQIVFSAPVVALGEVQPLSAPPPWLSVEPPMLARWRWAGTAELVGEPLAPLPAATTYRLAVSTALRSIGGEPLGAAHAWSFTTPLPACEIGRADEEGEAASGSPAFEVTLRCNQEVDPGSLAAALEVRVEPRPLPDAADLVPRASVALWEKEKPEWAAAWKRLLGEARGAAPSSPAYRIEPDAEAPRRVFRLRPEGNWPGSAQLRVVVGAGLRSLEGPEPSVEAAERTFPTAWPFTPRAVTGRAATGGKGLDPESLELQLSAPATWKDVAPHLRTRARGEETWQHVPTQEDEWWWDEPMSELRLGFLGLGGGREIEVCLGPQASDALGRALGFEWCGAATTGRRPPFLYLVEGDGVVEWDGPHLLPLKSVNVRAYRLRQRRVGEEELVPLLLRQGADAAMPEGETVRPPLAPDRGGLTPVDLGPVLAGRPGIVRTEIVVDEVEPGSEYDDHEARWLREPRSCLTQVTSLGLTVKSSRHEGTLAWVTRLADATPVEGAEVAVRDRDNRVVWRGRTDADGLARAGAEASGERIVAVTARVGDDLAYARAQWYEGHRGWDFNLPVDYSDQPRAAGVVWADRGVARPGESLHVKAVVRRQEERSLALPAEGTLSMVVFDPQSNPVHIADLAPDRWGAVESEVAIPEGAPLGEWDVVVGSKWDREARRWTGDDGWTLGGSFRVAEFRRPKFRVRAEAGAERLVAGDPLAARIEGTLLAGGGMAGAGVRWVVRAERASHAPAGRAWAEYEWVPSAFLDFHDHEEVTTVAEGRGELDRDGAFPVTLARVEAKDGWPTRLQVEGEVTDLDRQSSAGRDALLVLPGELLLGVKRPGYFITAAKGVESRVAVLAADGEAKAGVAVTVRLVRRHWESVRRREVSGRYVFESRAVQTPVAEQAVTSGAEPVPVRFDPTESGEYALIASLADARGNVVTASTDFYVFGSGYTPWRMDEDNRIELVAERGTVAPGETARVLVKSPWEKTTALVTVERAGVLEARVVELTGTMPVVDIPVGAEHIPNVFVSVVLLRGRVEAPADPELIDPGRPAYRIGMCAISVPPAGRRLRVAVKAEKGEYRPGQTATALVTVASEAGAPRQAGVTVWAVDAGVLDLTAYRTPDLFRALYRERGLGVATAESRSRLVGRRSYGTKADKVGGGGGREAALQVRQDFRALAVWRGDVVTDASGRATVSFVLPDSLTTYRLMAVATAGREEFGAGESEVIVTKPLGLEPALPRFLRPEDRARAGVLVRNRTREPREVEVTLRLDAGGPVALRGAPTRVVTVPAGGSVEAGFGLVGVAPGTATLRFVATSAKPSRETDAFEVTLPVVALAPSETVGTFFAVTGSAAEEIAVPDDVFPTSGGLEVSVAASPLVEAGAAVSFLADYPHGCAEQVSSQVLGLTAAARLGGGLAPREVKGRARDAWLQAAVGTLLACQRSDGGFAFWPDGWVSSPELSAHVAWALAEAKDAGARVDEGALQRAAEYLSAQLRRERWAGGATHGWTARLLASHALAALGAAEPAYLQDLYEQRRDAPAWGRALLAAVAGARSAEDPRVPDLIAQVRNRLAVEARTARLAEPVPEWGFLVWDTEPRASAAALMALSTLSAADPVADRLVRGLVDHLGRDRWRSTHDVAWMLQALAVWQGARGGAGGTRSVAADLGGRRLLRASLDPASAPATTAVPMAELQARAAKADGRTLSLDVRAEGGEVHAAALLRTTPRGRRPALDQGISLSRTLLDDRGRESGGVPAGEEVVLEVSVSCPATRRFVAVEVPLPAGLEALDPELATTASRVESGADSEWRGEGGEAGAGGFWWVPGFDHVELRDDRVLLYATQLAAGTTTTRVRCRATTAGAFVLAPARAEEMYAPEVFGSTPAARFEVLPPGR
ncbi:MAG: alpha-2-macroglobulin family protein [Acidobacteriota bacterium]